MKETVDPQIIEQLDPIARKYEEAVNNNDAAAVAALFTEDAVFVADTGPIYGRQAIEKYHVDLFKEWHFSNHLIKTDSNPPRIIGTAGDVALNGAFSLTVQGKTGDPIQLNGHYSAINTRQGNDWKILMLTPNVTPEPAPPAASAEAK